MTYRPETIRTTSRSFHSNSESAGENRVNVAGLAVRRPAVADGRELYHIVHPSDMAADLWTPDYLLARALYEQFERCYGSAHLHVETLYAGQYDAECMMHTAEAA
jgi:hypothetical protein